jgi:hypothetical protein
MRWRRLKSTNVAGGWLVSLELARTSGRYDEMVDLSTCKHLNIKMHVVEK